MKKILLLSLIFIGTSICAHAQKKYKYKKRTPQERARYFTKKMVDSLNVTGSQEDSLYEMNIIVSEKFDSLNVFVNDLEKRERSAAYRSIYQYRDSCMKTILPIKEFLKFQDIERERYELKKKRQARIRAKREEN